ncbi:MAG: sulfite exporter TauE/SafE family protein [Deltaproteobacteria bacterium]|nr:sulfite exporter TauE/SafE family protein [Deltaproteobacteria bacterium]
MDTNLLHLGALALVGVLSAAINTVAGGGSFITLPALMALGLPIAEANATNRLGVLLQAGSASLTFRSAGALPTGFAWTTLAPTLVGSLLGATLSITLDEAVVRAVIGVAMLLMLALMMLGPERWLRERPEAASVGRISQALAFFGMGVYGGFLQAGVGIFLMGGMVMLSGLDLKRANALKSLLVTLLTVPALLVFLPAGLVRWPEGLTLGLSSALGGWIGGLITLRVGPRALRATLIVVILTTATKLFGLW